MFLLAGLGNPDTEYKNTRHNFGFMVADAIIEKYSISKISDNKFHSIVHKGEIDGHPVLIIKPQTYMNRSGIALQEAMKFYKIDINSVIVLHDELDIDLGKVKIKIGGGHAGHNGLKDIDSRIGKEYKRIRLGIGRPPEHQDAASFVLSKFEEEELVLAEEVIYDVAKSIISELFEEK